MRSAEHIWDEEFYLSQFIPKVFSRASSLQLIPRVFIGASSMKSDTVWKSHDSCEVKRTMTKLILRHSISRKVTGRLGQAGRSLALAWHPRVWRAIIQLSSLVRAAPSQPMMDQVALSRWRPPQGASVYRNGRLATKRTASGCCF
ncbi:hypothetical protein AOLI_G00056320 [Acnodon oligacanthus]